MVSVRDITSMVAREYRVPEAFLYEPRPVGGGRIFLNPREVSHPRMVAMSLAYLLTDLTNPQIGQIFGRRNHATVLHARRRCSTDPEMMRHARRITLDLVRR